MNPASIYDDINNTVLSNNITKVPQSPKEEVARPTLTAADIPNGLNNTNLEPKDIKSQERQEKPPDAFNLYEDLNNADLGERVIQLQKHNEDLGNHITRLNKDIEKLCDELMRMKSTEEKLKKNISELFNTAKTEIARKDRMIADLRKRNDDLLFKRRSYVPNVKSSEESNLDVKKRSCVDSPTEVSGNKRQKCEPVDQLKNCNVDVKVVNQRSSNERGSSRSDSKSPKRQERSRSQSRYHSKTRYRNQSRSRHRNRNERREVHIKKERTRSRDFSRRNSRERLDKRSEFREKRSSISDKNSNSVINENFRSKSNEALTNYQVSNNAQVSENIKQEVKSKSDYLSGNNLQMSKNSGTVKIKQEVRSPSAGSREKPSKFRASVHIKQENSFAKDEHNIFNDVTIRIKPENIVNAHSPNDDFKGDYEKFDSTKHKNLKQEVTDSLIKNDAKINVSENCTEENLNAQISTINSIVSTETKANVINDSHNIANHCKETVEQLSTGNVLHFNFREVRTLDSRSGLQNDDNWNDATAKRVNANLRRRRRCVITLVD